MALTPILERKEARRAATTSLSFDIAGNFTAVISQVVAPGHEFLSVMKSLMSSIARGHYASVNTIDMIGESLVAHWQTALCTWEHLLSSYADMDRLNSQVVEGCFRRGEKGTHRDS